MVNVPSVDKRRLRWQGVRLTVLSVIIGCIVFAFVDIFPLMMDSLSSTDIAFDIIGMVILAVLASILSIPFSIIGGYTLGLLLEKTQWYKQGNAKVIVSGVIIAAIVLIVIFAIGSFLQLCLMSHGMCVVDFSTFMRQTEVNSFSSGSLTDFGRLFVFRFIKTLLIAMICGGITAWRLSRLAQE